MQNVSNICRNNRNRRFKQPLYAPPVTAGVNSTDALIAVAGKERQKQKTALIRLHLRRAVRLVD